MPLARTRATLIATVAVLSAAAAAAHAGTSFTTLYNFQGSPDGGNPQGRLIADSTGNLYGTTEFGGVADLGVLFKLAPGGNESVLFSFTFGNDGARPQGGLLRDKKGDLFGGTNGSGKNGLGTLFELTAAGALKVLYSFPRSSHANSPNGDLLEDAAGSLYGTAGGGTEAVGVVFRFTRPNAFTVLHTFTGTGGDGASPFSGLVGDPQGTMYGATLQGGDANCNCGVVYSVTSAGTTMILHGFTGAPNDGANPADAPLQLSDGSLVGVSETGGSVGLGTIYKILPDGTESVLHNFVGAPADGNLPAGRLVADPRGNLYGVASRGGANDDGVVFELSSTGHFSILHSFTNGADGGIPVAGLLRGAKNAFYGTTNSGGSAGNGTVFEITP
jgi:uncharacterized repeat protein (TIGR03803 family)